ncbi:NADPH-dependent FMN reductase [Flavilitoribacter nigricans]|nr:NAD(P)H-dependent oxidoreductase [Flavilitoribacter nigricans]
MITVISGTNRKESESLLFARQMVAFLQANTDETVKLLPLESIPHDWFHPDMYEKDQQSPSLSGLQDDFVLSASKFLFVVPEYNGSIPGALKLFLDACSIREYQSNFKGKKAAMVGVATGRAGNLRGIDHLTAILHHMGTLIMPAYLPISRIGALTEEGNILDQDTLKVMEQFAINFLAF